MPGFNSLSRSSSANSFFSNSSSNNSSSNIISRINQQNHSSSGSSQTRPSDTSSTSRVETVNVDDRRTTHTQQGTAVRARVESQLDGTAPSSNWESLNVGQNVTKILGKINTNPQLSNVFSHQEMQQTFSSLEQAVNDGKINTKVNGSLPSLISAAAKNKDPKGDLAELKHAAYVANTATLAPGTSIVLGAKHGQDLKASGLPNIKVEEVEADVYYKTSDGVVHIDEVKLAPTTFTSKLDGGSKKSDGGQFGRYQTLIDDGKASGETHKVTVAIDQTGPGFDKLLDNKRLTAVGSFLSQGDTSQPVIKVGNRFFSVDDLKQMDADATKFVSQKIQEAAEAGTGQPPGKIAKEVIKTNFDTMESTFATLGREYGTPAPAARVTTDSTATASIPLSAGMSNLRV